MLATGKRAIVWKRTEACDSLVDSELSLPCGQCIGCRLERSRQWAMRCVHEASLHEANCFLTLTYDDSHLPEGGSLRFEDFRLFMKRLRRFAAPKKVRFFHCGEYGELLSRPHFHACIFGFDFEDKVLWSVRDNVKLYRSPSLEGLWEYGFSTIGDVTWESAAYVARYVMKKVNGEAAKEHYKGLKPEYVTMSRRPGIGKGWYEKFRLDLYPSDFYIVHGRKVKPAKYYDSLYGEDDPVGFAAVKSRRVSCASKLVPTLMKSGVKKLLNDNDSIRLGVKEAIKSKRLKLLTRSLEAV